MFFLLSVFTRTPSSQQYRSNLEFMSHVGVAHARLSPQFIRSWRGRRADNTFKPAGYNYNRSCGRCLGTRWESPRKQWPCSSTREMAKLLPSAGIVEKVFNYLIDRVTGTRTQPLPRHPARCSVAKMHTRLFAGKGPPPLSRAAQCGPGCAGIECADLDRLKLNFRRGTFVRFHPVLYFTDNSFLQSARYCLTEVVDLELSRFTNYFVFEIRAPSVSLLQKYILAVIRIEWDSFNKLDWSVGI